MNTKGKNKVAKVIDSEVSVIDKKDMILKECEDGGVTLKEIVRVIREGMEANKVTIDKYGDEHIEVDHDKRLKSAIFGAELRRDIGVKNVDGITVNYLDAKMVLQQFNDIAPNKFKKEDDVKRK